MFGWNWMYTTVCKCTSFVLIYIEIKIERMSNKTFFRFLLKGIKTCICVVPTLQNWLFSQGKLKWNDSLVIFRHILHWKPDHETFHVLPLQLHAYSEFDAASYFKPVGKAATKKQTSFGMLKDTGRIKRWTRNRWLNMMEILGELLSARCRTFTYKWTQERCKKWCW